MPAKDYHRILGLRPGATERQIKVAYRKMAMKYHPDLNSDKDAVAKFHEIDAAYDFLMEHGSSQLAGEAREAHEEAEARDILHREREKMQQQARARREKKRREEEMFSRPEWHDPILLARYVMNGFALLFALTAVTGPVLIAILDDPVSLAGTSIFIVAGIFLLVYIYRRRKSWFRLGRFKTHWKDVAGLFRMGSDRSTKERCCYRSHAMGGGKAYRIEMIRTESITVRSHGALNHEVGYKNRAKRVVLPRSVKALFYHRMASMLRLISLLSAMFLFPVSSLAWRFLAGLLTGALLSALLLALARVRPKGSYLFTPGLILKIVIWILALVMISEWGPGFDVHTSGYIYLILAGLLFFLDMVFDLLLGFFPFYKRMFRPVIRQGRIMEQLYDQDYRNYQELPVYSVVYPLVRWLL